MQWEIVRMQSTVEKLVMELAGRSKVSTVKATEKDRQNSFRWKPFRRYCNELDEFGAVKTE